MKNFAPKKTQYSNIHSALFHQYVILLRFILKTWNAYIFVHIDFVFVLVTYVTYWFYSIFPGKTLDLQAWCKTTNAIHSWIGEDVK